MKFTAERIQELDHLTMSIEQVAREFGVSWSAAAARACALGLATRQDLDAILELAQQERVARILSE